MSNIKPARDESATDTSIYVRIDRAARRAAAQLARWMADDIERQSLPTTGPEALRKLASVLEGPQ